MPLIRNQKVYVSIVAGNGPGMYEFYADYETDPDSEWHVEVSWEELEEVRRLKAERDAYYKLCAKLKAREVEPLA